jgi:phosphomannomutase
MTENMITDYDIRGTTEIGLTIEDAWNIGKAVADWLPTAGNVIVVSYTMEQELTPAIIEGLRLQGRNAIDGGVGSVADAIVHIQAGGLSGAVVVGFDQAANVTTIELYQEEGRRIENETGLKELAELVNGGNFVPAAVKGELTAIA